MDQRVSEALGWRGQTVQETTSTDPDGHVWEIAHNPAFPLADDGSLVLPDVIGEPG